MSSSTDRLKRAWRWWTLPGPTVRVRQQQLLPAAADNYLDCCKRVFFAGEQLTRTLEIERQAARDTIKADHDKHQKEIKELKDRCVY